MMPALANDVAICNLALTGYLGKPGITSFTQAGVEAVRCKQFYPLARDFVARKSDWTFLRERAALAEVTNTAAVSWSKAYAFPPRALKFRYLYEPSRPTVPEMQYQIVGPVIFTHLSPAYAHYTTLEDRAPSGWPLHFQTAIAAKLYEYLAPFMTRRGSDVDAARRLAQQELSQAIEEDASQEFTTYVVDDSYSDGTRGDRRAEAAYDGSTFWGD